MHKITAEKFDQSYKDHMDYLSQNGTAWMKKKADYSNFDLHSWYLKGYNMQSVNFSNCKFSDCTFIEINFDGCIFDGASFSNCRFFGCSFQSATFRKSKLSKCMFHYSIIKSTNLNRIIVRNSILDDVSILSATMNDMIVIDTTGTVSISNSSIINGYIKYNHIESSVGNIEYDTDMYSNDIDWIVDYGNSNHRHRIYMRIIKYIKCKLGLIND